MCAALNYEVIEQRIRGEYSRLDMPEIYSGFHCEEFYLPMKDCVGLKTYIYRGENVSEPAPVILQRSPYVHLMPLYKTHGECLAKRGFIYVLQFCRGTGGSEGEWEPNVNEPEDGIDTINWLEGCDWAGNIGFWGSSYLALTGWCIADHLPSKVKGMYLAAYGTNRFVSAYEKNLFRHDVLTSWTMENAGFPVTADYMDSCRFRPHVEVDKALWGKEIPWYREMVSAPSGNEQYWHQGFWLHLRDIPSKMNTPLIIREGWYDHHLGSSLTSYESLSEEQKKKTTLLIGCWNHINANCIEWMEPENLKNSETESMVPFMKSLLIDNEDYKGKILIYIIGRDKWTELKQWPPVPDKVQKYWFSAEDNKKTFTADRPEGFSSAEYEFDPDNPVPSKGTESMLHFMRLVGSQIQPECDYRPDVLSFISDEIKEPMTIAGSIKVHLWVSSDCEDTAFTAKVMEILPDGRAVNIRSSITSIAADNPDLDYVPGEPVSVTVDMWDIAWELHAGGRLRIDISSSDFPQYSVHTNYKGIWALQDKAKTAHQTILCGGDHPSWVEIPVKNL